MVSPSPLPPPSGWTSRARWAKAARTWSARAPGGSPSRRQQSILGMVLAQASGGGLVSGHARADNDDHPNILTELIKNCQRAVEREQHQPLVADAGELAVRDCRACFGRVGREPRAVEHLDGLGSQQGLGMANVCAGAAIFPIARIQKT